MIKKTVGKHLSRQEKEFFRTPEEYENHILKTAEEVKNIREALLKHANFNEWLDLYETKAREELRGAGLPDAARLLVDKGDFSKWRPLPPLPDNQKDLSDWKNKNAKHGHESEMSLDDYLLHAGYDCDGPEHITSRILVHINSFKENLSAGSVLNINLAFHTIFLIGVYTTLKRVYGKHMKGSSKGGKGKINPWREYGKKLLDQYPGLSQGQIWGKIPKAPDYDICNGYAFYKRTDTAQKHTEEYLIAEDDNCGVTREIKCNSFRVQYLQNKPKKNL